MNILRFLIDLFYRRRVALLTFLLLVTLTVLFASPSTFVSNQEIASTRAMPLMSVPKHVLVLFSYHRAEWSDNVQKGIESVFKPYQNVTFFYEYMDTKRLNTKEYLKTLQKIYIEKYAEARIDVVICVDNNALNLLVENRQSLLPNTPVVFCGINDYRPGLHASRPDVTGVVEYGDFSDTLKIAFKARPNATKLYVICDHTETGVINTRELLAALSAVAPGIQAVLTDHLSYKELSTTLQTAAPKQIAFFVSFWKDGTGRNIEPGLLETVFKKSVIPVFGRSEWMINHGMVGGKCVTGFAQGEAAARIALQILGGTAVSALPVDTNSPNQYLFDYQMMHHYLIDEDIFPNGSIGFNLPEHFYRISKPVGKTILVFSGLLLITLVILAVSIHQRRRALLALRKSTASLEQSESRYRGMIENIQDTFYRTNAQGILVFISPSGARLLGYSSPQEMIGRTITSFWNYPGERQDLLEMAERDGVVRDYEVVLMRKDGSPVPVSTTSSYYRDREGQILGVEGVFRDITERKQAEEEKENAKKLLKKAHDSLEQRVTERTLELKKSHEQLLHSEKLAAVGKLSASIAHEFNNPLQSVMTIIKGIEQYVPLEKTEAELVALALQECHRMKDLIAGLRDFFKPTSGILTQVDIHAILDSILLICRKDIKNRKITIIKKSADNIPPIMAVADQLKQVFLNLLNNAADACEGGGMITITTEAM